MIYTIAYCKQHHIINILYKEIFIARCRLKEIQRLILAIEIDSRNSEMRIPKTLRLTAITTCLCLAWTLITPVATSVTRSTDLFAANAQVRPHQTRQERRQARRELRRSRRAARRERRQARREARRSVPEIDGNAGLAVLALVGCGMVLVRQRMRKA